MKKFIARVIVYAGLLLGVCIVWHYVDFDRASRKTPVQVPRADVVGTMATQAPPALSHEEAGFRRPDGMDDAGWKQVSELRNMLLQLNQPVEFYATVLDQHANPIAGAILTAKLSRIDDDKLKTISFLKLKMGDEITDEVLHLVSDKEGRIRFAGRTGRHVFIESLAKDGYVWTIPKTLGVLIYEPGGKRRTTQSLEMADAFDPKKGYIFHLWKKGETERLATIGFPVPVQPYGTNWYAVNLFGGPVQDAHSADFRFWFETKKDAAGNSAREFRFEMADGGLVLEPGPYPYLAPEEGYVATLDWSYEPFGRDAKQDLRALLKKQFYVKIRNGKVYGAVTWHWADANVVSITAYLNPRGSRNLEPDPDKLITDPVEIQRLDKQSRER